MANDATTSSNLPVMLIENEKLEKVTLDVNVS